MCVPIFTPNEPKASPVTKQNEVPAPIDQDTRDKRSEERRRARLSSGRRSTILTGSLGLGHKANTTKKNLLGQ